MTMQFLVAEQTATAYHYRIWLDTTKQVRDPSQSAPAPGQPDNRPLVPDPTWVRDYQWGLTPPPGVTIATYQTSTQTEAKLLAQAEYQRLTTPTPAPTSLAAAGTTF